MKKVKIGIYGSEGRMGKDILLQARKHKNIQIVYLCEQKKHPSIGNTTEDISIGDNMGRLIALSDVIIDFTTPKATLELMKSIRKSSENPCLVTGTTGYSNIEEPKFTKLSKGMKILRSFNMSIGINLLKSLVKTSSNKIGSISDTEISEIHHNQKKDIPSGTAITLAESIRDGNKKFKKYAFREKSSHNLRKDGEIGFSSIRGGDVIGEHTVYFFLNGESLELTHKAFDRKVFSDGALKAAIWICGKKPGLYSIIDMLG